MSITMIGHSTVLIEIGGKRILTDPYFGTWGNPAYARITPPAEPREAFYDVDLVLVSHNHWDHIDRKFLQAIPVSVPVVAPKLAKWRTRRSGAKYAVGLATWEEQRFGTVTITAVPAIHIALTNGYIIQNEDTCIYFAGDTYYGGFVTDIGRRFHIDVALMPASRPSAFQ